MSRRDKLKGLFENTIEELATANFGEEERREPAGPVRSMALTLGRMEDEAKALQEALAAGHRVQDIDPALVDASFVRDRLGEAELAPDDGLVRSIAENGQEVPILVRPHPAAEGRFQIAYGHRRLSAVKLLGLKVKAVVREIDDESLVIAQGVENSARANLSYIERAVFAHALESRGFSRAVIMKALTTDKTELSKLLSVTAAVPMAVISAIGAAPTVGRRKWLAFAAELSQQKTSRLNTVVRSRQFLQAPTDVRFELAMKAVSHQQNGEVDAAIWKPEGGKLSGTIRKKTKSFTLSLAAEDAAAFGDFITARLDDLYREFTIRKSEDR